MTATRIGFGLLGAGLIAPFHARALRNCATARLVAVSDVNAERMAKLAADFGCGSYATLEEMLKNPEVQVINILTPNHLHFEAVPKAAQAGRHILVEKPPAMSLEEMEGMEAACRSAGVKIGVVLQCRMRKPIQAMREAIRQGRFGRLLHADTTMKWYRSTEYYQMDAWRMSRRSGAGVTIQQAFHYLDLLLYLMGPAKSVHARMNNLAHPKVELEDTLLAFLDYQNGAQGVVQASTALWPGTDLRVEVNGENGTAIMVGERMDTWKFKEERPEDAEIRTYGSAAVGTGASGPADLGFRDHQLVIEDMVESIQTGRDPLITLASVRPTLETALAMYLSAKKQAPVTLPLGDAEVW
jgi:predicted dehydrogenase